MTEGAPHCPHRARKQKNAAQLPVTLGKPNTLERPLTADELGRLGEAIAIAHPTEARRLGVVAFLEEQGPAVLSAMGVG